MKTIGLLVGIIVLFSCAGILRADNPVIVHEWGTFTCLQDEHGDAIGGINVDDEPVPDFVYGSRNGHVISQATYGVFGLPPYDPYAGKGESASVLYGDPSVTMRLETPVLYIYPPAGQGASAVPALDVHVDFHGGFLTQFYPFAASTSFAGQKHISDSSESSLTWKGVRVGSTGTPVATDDKVWTTPRETAAPLLEVHPMMKDVNGVVHDDAQVEHFLFYRGVGHLESPVYLNPDPFNVGEKGEFSLCPRWVDPSSHHPTPAGDIALDAQYAGGWLAEIHADGSCAFRVVPPFQEGSRTRIHPFTKVASGFSPVDFGRDNLAQLKASMHDVLVKEGLYPDEATAMLKTWELSYFKSPGLRFFYIVPRKWVDQVLPLEISGTSTEITRVMVGRIELVSDEERAALARLAAGPCPDLAAVKYAAAQALQSSNVPRNVKEAVLRGDRPLSDLGFKIPRAVGDYLSLGRFRDALIVHEQQQHPSDNLARFIQENGLASTR